MKKFLFILLFPLTIFAQRVTLPNGWSLTPAGHSFRLGDLPLNTAISSSKKYIAVTNNGYGKQYLQLIDVKKERVVDSIIIPKSWVGIKFTADEKYLYASGGNDNWILQYSIANNKMILKDSIKLGNRWPNKISPTGIDIDDAKHLLYVVTKDNNSLYIIDLITKKIVDQYKLNGEAYTCLLSPNKKELYITCWGCDKLLVFDTEQKKFVNEIEVGDNPNDMCLSKNGKYLFVANANDNSVSVIDAMQKKVIETLNCALYPNSLTGSTTNGVCLNEAENTLYIANADNNCLAVFDVSHPGSSASKGFIPTGWYPTCVKVVGNKIFVTNGKGFSSFANPLGPNPTIKKQKVIYQEGETIKPAREQYIGGLFIGTMSVINEPSQKQLSEYSRQVYKNTPYIKDNELLSNSKSGNPIPKKIGDASPIKYVFYIIKENRTYDQVLGDVKEGNGDPALVLFGEHITPNQHKLAKEFVLLDNFYCDGEVSADGHNWSMGAYATDYLEKNWVTSYGGRGGEYDAEGNREIANNKGGFIWDHAKHANVTYRTYGEFAEGSSPNIPVLKDHLCTYYTGWNLKVRDTTRFNQWRKDFDSLVAKNALPHLNTLRLPNDHTEGMNINKPTPFAHVADNDLAVGMFIEHLSKSSVWKESVVFILEDDAQNGPDHVDAHRSPAYVAGPFVKRHFVDHTPYTTTGMLHTMELILGIPPMTQYDAAAEPLWRCFTDKADVASFTSLNNNINLSEKNTAINELSKKSESFDFAKEDKVPDLEFTEVLWKGIKGINAVVPSPTRSAFLKVSKKKDND